MQSVRPGMLDDMKLGAAVEISNRAYRLLLWLNSAMESGFISLEHGGRYVSDPEAAQAWLVRHFADLPREARPTERAGPELRRFANYFATYLTSSFDLHEVPGTRFDPGPGGYCCPRCGRFVAKSHLQPKKLRRRDKEQAQVLKRSLVEALAGEEGFNVSNEAIARLLERSEQSRNAALASYGVELLRRIDGRTSGSATLALWREFAWSPKGSPIKGFKLEARAIKQAKGQLVDALRQEAA